MNPECDVYRLFAAHIGLQGPIGDVMTYAAWSLWRDAYKAGWNAALKQEPPCDT